MATMRNRNLSEKYELAELQPLMALALQSCKVAAFDWDLDKGLVDYYGFVKEQFSPSVDPLHVGTQWFLPNLHPADREAAHETLNQAAGTLENVQFEHCARYQLPSGQCVWILAKAKKTFSVDHGTPRVMRLLGTLEDVTIEREKEEHFASILESIGDGFVTFDENWNYTFVNKKAEVLLGRSTRQLVGKAIWELFPDIVGSQLEIAFRTAMAGTPTSYEYYYEPWGRWFTNFCSPKLGGGIAVYFQDVTKRRTEEQERDLSKSRAALEQVNVAAQTLAALAHELNQPLMALQANWGSLTHLLKDVAVSQEVSLVLQESEKQAQRASDVFSDLIGRINTWRQGNLTVSKYDVHALIATCADQIAVNFPKLSVELQLQATAATVFGDSVQVEKALMNLLTNAAETWNGSASEGAYVFVKTETQADHICIAVLDAGPGVPLDIAKSLFTEFRSSKKFGLGLGLSISKSLVEAQGGRIWFQGNLKPGAEFRMELPIAV